MKRTKETQFNVRIVPHIARQLAALAKLKGVSQGRLVEELAAPTIERLADALEMKQHA